MAGCISRVKTRVLVYKRTRCIRLLVLELYSILKVLGLQQMGMEPMHVECCC